MRTFDKNSKLNLRCGTSGYGLVEMVVLGGCLDSMILEVFSNLWYYDFFVFLSIMRKHWSIRWINTLKKCILKWKYLHFNDSSIKNYFWSNFQLSTESKNTESFAVHRHIISGKKYIVSIGSYPLKVLRVGKGEVSFSLALKNAICSR